jgi:hypothetical protein
MICIRSQPQRNKILKLKSGIVERKAQHVMKYEENTELETNAIDTVCSQFVALIRNGSSSTVCGTRKQGYSAWIMNGWAQEVKKVIFPIISIAILLNLTVNIQPTFSMELNAFLTRKKYLNLT